VMSLLGILSLKLSMKKESGSPKSTEKLLE
jgi:hypothetical protein